MCGLPLSQYRNDSDFNKQFDAAYEVECAIGKALIQIRIDNRIKTQKALAEFTEIDLDTIIKIEDGEYIPSRDVIQKIADKIGADFQFSIFTPHQQQRA